MPAIAASASRTQGQTDVDDDSAGLGEAVAETGVLVLLVGAGVDVDVEVSVAVEVVVDVSVSVAVEVDVEVAVEVLVDVEDEVRVEVSLLVGATSLGVLGGRVVAEATGVRDGMAGRLPVRDPLGKFDPPPHDTMSAKTITGSAIEPSRIRLVLRTTRPFRLAFPHLSRVPRKRADEADVRIRQP